VELIQRALAIGFSLSELKAILAARDSGGAPCRHVRKLLNSTIAQVDRQIERLNLLRGELRRLSKDWDTRLLHAGPGEPARLLENVPLQVSVPADFAFPLNKKKKGR
jgi:DNA-binding transcriptional MerR regulator